MQQKVNDLFTRQLASWPMAHDNYAALAGVRVKTLDVDGIPYKVQFNPARIVSSGAKVDDRSIRERRCFLCAANRPEPQEGIPFGGHYDILVNPYPIFPRHLTIPDTGHVPQRIASRFGDMLQLAKALQEYTVFYNGPRCGASAPDHAHFQAGSRDFMPIERIWSRLIADKVAVCGRSTLYRLADAPRHTLVVDAAGAEEAQQLFRAVYESMPVPEGDEEPMMNVLALYDDMRWTVFIFPRSKHRPACYTAEGEARLLSSPASVDLGGVFITPLEHDFEKITAGDIRQILSEVCFSEEDFADLCRRIPSTLLSFT